MLVISLELSIYSRLILLQPREKASSLISKISTTILDHFLDLWLSQRFGAWYVGLTAFGSLVQRSADVRAPLASAGLLRVDASTTRGTVELGRMYYWLELGNTSAGLRRKNRVETWSLPAAAPGFFLKAIGARKKCNSEKFILPPSSTKNISSPRCRMEQLIST